MKRCDWANSNLLGYHDEEWGVPVHDDQKLFEMLILEGAQAGLSWETVFRKREAYRRAFYGFDPKKVARMTDNELEEQLKNPEIIRNRNKIFTTRKNAVVFLDIQKEFCSFDTYIWQFVGGKPINGKRETINDIPAKTAESDAISKDLKKRGMSFIGPTIMYAFMQAVGIVNDHLVSCFRYSEVKEMH
jgi:DNA-3-methyladenine glycosylase I